MVNMDEYKAIFLGEVKYHIFSGKKGSVWIVIRRVVYGMYVWPSS
jgi:hypothetical protein